MEDLNTLSAIYEVLRTGLVNPQIRIAIIILILLAIGFSDDLSRLMRRKKNQPPEPPEDGNAPLPERRHNGCDKHHKAIQEVLEGHDQAYKASTARFHARIDSLEHSFEDLENSLRDIIEQMRSSNSELRSYLMHHTTSKEDALQIVRSVDEVVYKMDDVRRATDAIHEIKRLLDCTAAACPMKKDKPDA